MEKRAKYPDEEGPRARGRQRSLTKKKKAEVLAALRVGASRIDAAKLVGVHVTTIANEAERDADFLDDLDRAEATCKIVHIKKLHDAKDWRSSAHYLKVRHPADWGTKTTETSGEPLPDIALVEVDEGLAAMEKELISLREKVKEYENPSRARASTGEIEE